MGDGQPSEAATESFMSMISEIWRSHGSQSGLTCSERLLELSAEGFKRMAPSKIRVPVQSLDVKLTPRRFRTSVMITWSKI